METTTIMPDNTMLSTTHITDLCTNCLLMIFKYLEVSDLANLTEATAKLKQTNKIDRYREAIIRAFKIQVGAHEWKTEIYADANFAPNHIKMLKSFGSVITSLSINYHSRNRRYESAFDDAISNYCWETLSSIDFKCLNSKSMNELQRPFLNVRAVEFSVGHLGNTLGQLNKWFPKMVELEFRHTHVFDPKCIHEHFPQLESLSVSNGLWQESKKGKTIFSNSDLKVFVQLNPQLAQLNIRHDDVDETVDGCNGIIVDAELLTFINENLEFLDTLKLNLESYRFDQKWQSTVTIERITTLEVDCGYCNCLDKIKIATPELIELNVNLTDQQDEQLNYEALATFAIRVEPTQLKINAEYQKFSFDDQHILRMTRMLPALHELIVACNWDDAISDAVLNLLVNSDTLEKLVGAFHFLWDHDEQRPNMQEMFREKIVRNDAVRRKWTYKFSETDDGVCYIYTIEFHKKK